MAFYKDLDISAFESEDPNSIVIEDDEAIKFSVMNILLTNKGERLSDPNFGCNIRKLLFENISPVILWDIEKDIEYVLKQYEPRVELLKVDSEETDIDSNIVKLKIYYKIKQLEFTDSVVLTFERIK